MSVKKIIKPIIKYPYEQFASHFGAHRQSSREPRLWIMMYHRILPQNDPRYLIEEPGMIVEPETFRLHLKTLKNEFSLVSLSDWISRRKKGETLPLKACAVTFDDGWLDNYEYAYPILKEEQVPATLFAVSQIVGTLNEFWPNRIQRLLNLPEEKLKSITWLTKVIGNSTPGKDLTASVIYSLKSQTDDKLIELIENTEDVLGIKPATSPSLVNNEQLNEMANNGIIEIGSHTSRHIRLNTYLGKKILESEIIDSKSQLQNIINKPVGLFCYPNGDFSKLALDLVSKHYNAAVTTKKGINFSNKLDFHTLKRFGVHQDISSNKRQFLARISGW